MHAKDLQLDLKKLANKEKAMILQGFFKTGPGEYGEGDIFLGITVPIQRNLAKNYYGMELPQIQKLLTRKIHEERLTALFILIKNYETAKREKNINAMEKIFDFYLENTKNINNWDLVDLSAPNIIGDYLLERKNVRKALYKLAKSKNLWSMRIAILSTYTFIKNNDFSDTIRLSEIFLGEEHDLMHKAVGWMLREVGKKDEKVLVDFLDKHYKKMPRTMLRYAIEKFDENKRKYYLNLK